MNDDDFLKEWTSHWEDSEELHYSNKKKGDTMSDFSAKAIEEYEKLIEFLKNYPKEKYSKSSYRGVVEYSRTIYYWEFGKDNTWMNIPTFEKLFHGKLYARYDSELEAIFGRVHFVQKAISQLTADSKASIKIIENRIKQVEKQEAKKRANKAKKDGAIDSISSILTQNSYNVSKVVGGSDYRSYYSHSRKVADKWHKYINTADMPNIKFATVEVKILTNDIKFGVKIETSGDVGCSFDDFEKVYQAIKQETETIKKLIIQKGE